MNVLFVILPGTADRFLLKMSETERRANCFGLSHINQLVPRNLRGMDSPITIYFKEEII